jgi:septum formation protein
VHLVSLRGVGRRRLRRSPEPPNLARVLILASTSRARAELLGRLEIPFEAAAPDFDEEGLRHRFAELSPADFALELARGKALSLRANYPEAWILAGDQVGVLPGDSGPVLLSKPGDVDRAVKQLLSMAGKTHELWNGIVLAAPSAGPVREIVDCQRLTMRSFGEPEARAYVERHRPLECAGAYRVEDAGIRLFERIEGEDFTGIMGLPLLAVARLLREVGLLEG